MSLTTVVTDTFTEASNVALGSHTSDSGHGWNVWNGAIQVNATADAAEDNNGSSGNRANCTRANSVDEYDVYGTITQANGGAGSNQAAGVTGRATSATGVAAYEFSYDWSVNSWRLDDNTAGNSDVVAEAFPGVPCQLKLEVRDSNIKGYAWNGSAWVQKVTRTTNQNNGTGVYAGIILVNFSGSAGSLRLDDFRIDEYTASSSVAFREYYSIMG